jgi:hypothetical protein
MAISVIKREFSPAEAAAITGVSTALQRDWRRREVLKGEPNPEGKWTRWSLTDIIRLSVMKLFSDAGMDVSSTTMIASMALLPTLGALALIDEAVEFDGEISDVQKARIRSNTVGTTDPSHTIGRFLASFGKGEYDVCRTDDLASLEARLDEEARPILSVVDCRNLARLIVERAGGPVIRYEVTE